MNYIQHNNFRLPVMGAKITDSNPQEKEEYIRLLNKISRDNNYFTGRYDYYGISNRSTAACDWCWATEADATTHFPLIPTQEAITWLKLAVKEITADNFAVDVTKEDGVHSETFKWWFSLEFYYQNGLRFLKKYYGVKNGIHFFSDEIPSVPLIKPTMFYEYFHQHTDVVSEPVKGDEEDRWIELTGKPQEAPDCDMWLWRKNGEVEFSAKGDFVEIGYHTHYMIVKKPLPPPKPSKEEIKRKEAEEWLEKYYDNKNVAKNSHYIEILTAYKIDQEK